MTTDPNVLEGTTPGPWRIYDRVADGDRQDHAEECCIESATDRTADWVAQNVYNNADARLIAAAPDLASEVATLRAENERLAALAGQHDPTGADHMEEMWVHAQRADKAEAALRAIASEDYRGPVPESVRIARAALASVPSEGSGE